jgi:hypothetical protein
MCSVDGAMLAASSPLPQHRAGQQDSQSASWDHLTNIFSSTHGQAPPLLQHSTEQQDRGNASLNHLTKAFSTHRCQAAPLLRSKSVGLREILADSSAKRPRDLTRYPRHLAHPCRVCILWPNCSLIGYHVPMRFVAPCVFVCEPERLLLVVANPRQG